MRSLARWSFRHCHSENSSFLCFNLWKHRAQIHEININSTTKLKGKCVHPTNGWIDERRSQRERRVQVLGTDSTEWYLYEPLQWNTTFSSEPIFHAYARLDDERNNNLNTQSNSSFFYSTVRGLVPISVVCMASMNGPLDGERFLRHSEALNVIVVVEKHFAEHWIVHERTGNLISSRLMVQCGLAILII